VLVVLVKTIDDQWMCFIIVDLNARSFIICVRFQQTFTSKTEPCFPMLSSFKDNHMFCIYNMIYRLGTKVTQQYIYFLFQSPQVLLNHSNRGIKEQKKKTKGKLTLYEQIGGSNPKPIWLSTFTSPRSGSPVSEGKVPLETAHCFTSNNDRE